MGPSLTTWIQFWRLGRFRKVVLKLCLFRLGLFACAHILLIDVDVEGDSCVPQVQGASVVVEKYGKCPSIILALVEDFLHITSNSPNSPHQSLVFGWVATGH